MIEMENNSLEGPEESMDEALYSRQLYVLGHTAMRCIQSSNVLISGMKGLGVEIAKNVVLGGVKSVTIHDSGNATWTDLSAQFFLREADIGKNRAEVTLPRLAELNSYVPCNCYTEELTETYLKGFQVVVLTDSGMEEQIRVGEFCHTNGIKFIVAETRGLAGMIFCDFGDEFLVTDNDGNQSDGSMVTEIDQDGVVTCYEESGKGFEDGDYVQFSDVHGMTELNSHEPIKIKCLEPHKFSIGSVTEFSPYKSGGIVTKVKMSRTINFKSIKEALHKPDFVTTDVAKSARSCQLHIAFQALHEYVKRTSHLPRSRNQKDAAEFMTVFNEINAYSGVKCVDIDEELIKEFAFGARGDLCPLATAIGGITAQEVLKACSGKFNPIFQYLYFDALECLPRENRDEVLTEESCSQRNNRYDGQVAVFGDAFQNKLSGLKYFLVGAGAVGCEVLKNWAMMGVACGESGQVHITDVGIIKKSNLNRHFLFRPSDISMKKSSTAARTVKVMNSSFKIIAHENNVDADSEHIYTDHFFEQLDGVVSAVDNNCSRLHIDRQCVYRRKPLLHTENFGTKTNVQVIIPFMTESSQMSPSTSIPVHALKNFPFTSEHTVLLATSLFQMVFTERILTAKSYLDEADFMDKTLKQSHSQAHATLTTVRKVLVDNRPSRFKDCVAYGRIMWQKFFSYEILHLLSRFPADQMTNSGKPFWSGIRRCPHPLSFDCNNDTHLKFVMAVANLSAEVYGLEQERDKEAIKAMINKVVVPEFIPKTETESLDMIDSESTEKREADAIQKLKDQLPSPGSLKGFVLHPVEFEKDDDSNFHMDFIVACSNLRAENYDIPPADRHKSKLIAGRIVPSIATSTSVLAGLACLEMYKIVQGHKEMKLYKNSVCNLAQSFFDFSEPVPAIRNKYNDEEFTLWDRFEIQGEMTLQEFIDYFQKEYNLEISFLAYRSWLLYAFFLSQAKKQERLGLPLSEVVRKITKKDIPSYTKYLIFEIGCDDNQGEDVEVPYVRYTFPD